MGLVVPFREEDAVDEYLHPLELVRIHQAMRGVTAKQGADGVLTGRRHAVWCGSHFRQRGEHRRKGPITAMADVIISGRWNGRVVEFFEYFYDQRQSPRDLGDSLHRVFTGWDWQRVEGGHGFQKGGTTRDDAIPGRFHQ